MRSYDPAGELTTGEATFIEHFATHGNASAAVDATWPGKFQNLRAYGWKLLQRPRVARALMLRRAEISAVTKLDAVFIERGLMREAVSAESDSARVRALELLGRRVPQFFAPERVEVDDVTKLTPEEREQRRASILAAALARSEAAK